MKIIGQPGEIYPTLDKDKIRFSYEYIDEALIEPNIKRIREIIEDKKLMEVYHDL
ncbi:hypothetical protein [Macrococcoides caseolyticum]|uniref:hypothetical protein n=1 Tax=Macrococcoides caseolyticum TaxID=69966 RepID=UPI001314A7CF|nr:hypothetical protein [Macrococcus caseolyticus]